MGWQRWRGHGRGADGLAMLAPSAARRDTAEGDGVCQEVVQAQSERSARQTARKWLKMSTGTQER